MNLKKTALLLAMAGIVAAPMAAQAETYASARIGLQHLDTGGESELTVRGFAARMGLKGEHDLGNGMTSFGKYEFGIGTEGDSANVSRRHAYVGMKGDFGSVTLGQAYHTFYNFAYGPTDIPWWGAGNAVVLSPGRTAQALTYAGGSGAVKFGASLYMDGSSGSDRVTGGDADPEPNNIDKIEIAVSFDAGFATIAVAMSDQDESYFDSDADTVSDFLTPGFDGDDADAVHFDPDPVIMITASGIQAGPVDLTIGYQMQDLDDKDVGLDNSLSAIIIHAGLMDGYLHYESLDLDADSNDNPTSLTLGYTQSIGRNTSAWYEYQTIDADSGDSDDDEDYIRAVLKVDF